ncbi:MAG TPA: right-handed parallel beta-helix repeat-containing protein [Candidatus Limnocylindria bacterium]|nr:right-handed parallel beta-helix repeat-containing protein [Candidatus Limnocylindria bacterium]
MRAVIPAAAVLALAVAGSSSAITLSVPGTFATIQEAVDAARSGDVIKVGKGTFAPFTVFDKTDLTIKGTRNATVVDGAGVAAVVIHIRDSERITLDRLGVRYAADRGIDIEDSTSVVVRRCRISDHEDALRVHGTGGVLVEKNRFFSIVNDAADFSADFVGPAHDSQIRKNRFTDIGAEAIEVEGTNNVVEKNHIKKTGGAGIALEDSASGIIVRNNRVSTTRGDGVVLVGTGHTIEKNAVVRAGDDGIVVEASGSMLLANRVTRAADNGIEVGPTAAVATANVFERNRVIGSVRSGFVVADGGNTFRRNRAAGSGVFDLVDTAGAGANLYEKNQFGSSQTE